MTLKIIATVEFCNNFEDLDICLSSAKIFTCGCLSVKPGKCGDKISPEVSASSAILEPSLMTVPGKIFEI